MGRPEELKNEGVQDSGKREFFKKLFLPAIGIATLTASERYFRGFAAADGNPANGRIPFEHGESHTYSRWVDAKEGFVEREHHLIDVAPEIDVANIVALDFEGRIRTGALLVHKGVGPEGVATESRVVMNVQFGTLKYVQFQPAIGGDSWRLYKIMEHGGFELLDKICRFHADKTGRPWQDVYYIGDLGLFQQQWGDQEQELIHRIVRAQLPSMAGVQPVPFVNPGLF